MLYLSAPCEASHIVIAKIIFWRERKGESEYGAECCSLGVGIVVQLTEPPFGMLTSQIREPAQVPASLCPVQVPPSMPGRHQMMTQVCG